MVFFLQTNHTTLKINRVFSASLFCWGFSYAGGMVVSVFCLLCHFVLGNVKKQSFILIFMVPRTLKSVDFCKPYIL